MDRAVAVSVLGPSGKSFGRILIPQRRADKDLSRRTLGRHTGLPGGKGKNENLAASQTGP